MNNSTLINGAASLSYFDGYSWSQITRDERFFCQALYSELCSEPNSVYQFLSNLIKDSGNNNESSNEKNERLRVFKEFLSNEKLEDKWEPGFEVVFYRDLAHKLKESQNSWVSWVSLYLECYQGHQLPFKDVNHDNRDRKIIKSLSKRTFDLSLFHKNYFIIIEAKAHGGFDGRQLESIKLDKKMVKLILENRYHEKAPEVLLFGLYSSKYSPKPETLNGAGTRKSSNWLEDVEPLFDATFTWDYLAKRYPDKKQLFERANKIYKS